MNGEMFFADMVCPDGTYSFECQYKMNVAEINEDRPCEEDDWNMVKDDPIWHEPEYQWIYDYLTNSDDEENTDGEGDEECE